MRLIENYIPPSTGDLADLKGNLRFTGQQMAELAGVSNSNQWRKYTGGEKPRALNQHVLFFIAAQLALDPKALELILDKMRALGAEFEENLMNHE
ncbi:XRE family transcriptional regulator [Xenorhabdus bovienii]|uniref:XRE family transcriptional regulator n=1 Tax=Xenorhabdus bovienii TaxID=40576 RepID=A0AAJ1MZ43_XENBV|nr:XRE family transcriptional regulator [Xenorhabdus bovienii]MDE1478358.1 XRE family transcriptional regulator [Xenorhabdus bovienii]MDE1486429.1 XRE family transcriptional regulator [Xenorhabdus bovienii]MDE1497149.1 XRE family transcriptional regulator [Xenorhabdus bovienii]MDE9472473.1 XRE family transcriptional regulator [Xenorhabdus bovienii]MDE9477254.1 XRE family transcriptional regulator [Xenorhabdus bovienii]